MEKLDYFEKKEDFVPFSATLCAALSDTKVSKYTHPLPSVDTLLFNPLLKMAPTQFPFCSRIAWRHQNVSKLWFQISNHKLIPFQGSYDSWILNIVNTVILALQYKFCSFVNFVMSKSMSLFVWKNDLHVFFLNTPYQHIPTVP